MTILYYCLLDKIGIGDPIRGNFEHWLKAFFEIKDKIKGGF